MACILLWSSAVRVHDSQAYRQMDVTRDSISRILELREFSMLLLSMLSWLGILISYNWAQVLEACDCLKLLSIHFDLCVDGPRELTFMWWGCCGLCFWHKPTELPHSFLLCSCVYFCLYGPFNCISFHKSRQLSAFSLCSSGFISALLVLSTIYLFRKVSFSTDIILCGWLGLKHQLTN